MAKEGLDGGRRAIHGEADGSRGREDAHLRVAISVARPQRLRIGPALHQLACKVVLAHLQKQVEIDARGLDSQVLVRIITRPGDAGVVADDACHMALVEVVAGKGTSRPGHNRRSGVASTGHNANKGRREGAGARRIVGQALCHQQARKVGDTQTRRTEPIGFTSDVSGGELTPGNGCLQRQLGHIDRVLETLYIERARRRIKEPVDVDGAQVTA